jgi:teichuronic acid biosynthesis glycosyltransferase TuaC
VSDQGFNTLVLSHLYPSTAFPALGPFVKDEVVELAKRNRIAVMAPLAVPSLRNDVLRRLRAVPASTLDSGVPVVRPRIVALPVGGTLAEPPLWSLCLRKPLTALADHLRADLIHAHFALPDGFAAARFAARRNIPFVLTVRGSDVIASSRRAASRRFLRQTLIAADAVVAVSQDLAERVASFGVASERIQVVAGVHYPAPLSRAAARRRLGVPDEAVVIVWIGGLVRVKQPLEAIRAFEIVRTQSDLRDGLLRLVMLGDGPLRGDVDSYIESRNLQGFVHAYGHIVRESVWMWQSAADVLLNSSSSEGTPAAVLEAVGAGTSVAAFPLAGIAAVTEAVEGGSVADSMSTPALADALGRELSKTRNRRALARRARARYDIAHAAAAVEAIYAGVV